MTSSTLKSCCSYYIKVIIYSFTANISSFVNEIIFCKNTHLLNPNGELCEIRKFLSLIMNVYIYFYLQIKGLQHSMKLNMKELEKQHQFNQLKYRMH